MVVKIRLARFGRKNSPFYNIVVAHARTARNSKPLEVIGTYDPVPKPDPYDNSGRLHKDIKLDAIRARYWIGVGAQPTDTVWRMLSMVGDKIPQEPRWPPIVLMRIAAWNHGTKVSQHGTTYIPHPTTRGSTATKPLDVHHANERHHQYDYH
ncbi:ribosomal protein S16 domain-containing protein [Xylaria cubensis]|nr:ribosomal protein S16 domain-containing protein [Xylaria cubensis]